MAARDVDGPNAGYAQLLLDEYLENPDAVPPEWREVFERGDGELLEARPGLRRLLEAAAGNGHTAAPAPRPRLRRHRHPHRPSPAPAAPAPAVDEELLEGVSAAASLVRAYRAYGHLAARLDPLGSEPPGEPALEPDRYDTPLTPELQARIPARLLRLHVPGETLAEALPHLQRTYCGTIAYEIEHIADYEQRLWLRQAIESGRFREPLTPDEKRRLLTRLTEVEGFEVYLRRTFLGQKQFSIEGLDVMVPMLDVAIELAAEQGAHEVALGMAHRGRLNVLAHIVGRPYEHLLREFEGERTIEAVSADPEGGSGDVKYHLGARGTRRSPSGEITVELLANPSHLEAVDPVVEGWTRAKQTDRSQPEGRHDGRVVMPVLIHGDASFAGQGVVAETLNLDGLAGYSTGGTLHLISNNQVGFTTNPADGRSTRYSSDLAKGFDVPIIHVNADDPEAAISAVRLALAFRRRFGADVVIDLVGYRRHGHNETDEAAYTQPLMAEQILRQTPVREQFAARLAEEGVIAAGEGDELVAEMQRRIKSAHETLKKSLAAPAARAAPTACRRPRRGEIETAVPADVLRELNEELLRVPPGFEVNAKLARQLERRRQTVEEGGIDWGQAEALAFASLLVDGIPVRLTGQDTERGTFSHRHLVLHDARTDETYVPMQHLPDARAAFEVFNSPLSEYAALGFEYGYSVSSGDALVLWEAQFGDFVNGAQIVIDQFLVAGLSKWRQSSRLTLLLPHGYEGNGPEHSSARLERFLQLAAQENIRVANATTAAQYFHLLRRQALDPSARPLVVMSPKGLLRLREAGSRLEQLSEGRFEPILRDEGVDPERVRRLVIASGKVYYDIAGHEARAAAEDVAVARLEQLYPFPVDAAAALVASYPNLEEIVWAQEEPQNMGAVARHPAPAGGGGPRAPARLRRPAVAGEHERGLPDGAPRGAGPHRARGARRRAARA